MRKYLAIPLALCCAGCAPTPSWYGVPAQHKPFVDKVPQVVSIPEFGEFVRSEETDAERYFIKDVKGLEGTWRWTFAEPEFRFFIRPTGKSRKFHLELGINDRTFKDTGPVNLVITVNGKVLGRPTFTKFGDQTWEADVAPDMLLPDSENRVLIKVLNPWQAADPGVRLGFLLHAVGFLSQ
ncbi:MAG: hypothetical protein SGI92_28980 [Bryobacteraceae bacterium]|nr:hypothetical protein [Bryobacteraceae bacterium]